jgi:hypothetical protein
LQALLEGSTDVDFPESLQHRIEATILPGLRPVTPLPSARRVTFALLLCSIAVTTAANWRLGVAGWHARSAVQSLVDFSLQSVSILALANLLANQMAPGSRLRAAIWIYVAAPICALLAADALLFSDRSIPDFARVSLSCWTIGVACAAVSAVLFWLALRKGLSLYPVSHGMTAGLLGGLVGVTVLEIYCPWLDRLHISASHIGAAVTSTLVGAIWGGLRGRMQRRAA